MYQFVMSSYAHMIFNFIVQLLLGIPLDLVHGSELVLLVYQVSTTCIYQDLAHSPHSQLGVAVAALTVGFCIPEKVTPTPASSS